ncbi:MAG: hypothetical protein NW224_20055 [Leptolyngbyaceae cyanobacterium bins.302]|nr:hypothetical protein [Leptolyngbyaceae cyanobacterium bins.302]
MNLSLNNIHKIIQNKWLYIGLFLLSPWIVYFEVIFLGFTITNNEISADSENRLGKVLPVLDPVAGNLQDLPWLAKIGYSLRQFSIPLINLDNGLGATLLESLQSGVLYPFNILLPFMDLSSSQFFDLFSVLHVLILLINTFVLFKLYLRWELALVLALTFTFSWATFLSINMVHYRSFAWAPLIAWGAVKLARQHYSVRTTLITIFAIFCSITAGNPQESFFDLIVAVVFFGAELLVSGRFNWRNSLIFILVFMAGVFLASPSVLPYLVNRKQDLLLSVESADRSAIFFVSFPWLLGWIIQYLNGSFPHWYRQSAMSGDDYSVFAVHPLLLYILIAGFFVILLDRKGNSRQQILFLILLAAAFVSLINTSIFNPLREGLTQVPFINTIRYSKYIHHIHLLLGGSAAIALAMLVEAPPKIRRLSACLALAASAVLVLAIVHFTLTDPSWRFNYRRFDQMLMIWIGSILAVVIGGVILTTRKQELNWKALFIGMLLISLLIKPYGFFKAFPQYLPFPVAGLDFSQERMLSFADYANSNLLRQYEQIGVFDPVLRKHFTTLFAENFPMIIGGLHAQVPKDVVLNAQQVNVLRLMGVTAIVDHQAEANPNLTRVQPNFFRVNNPLPKVFLLNSSESINQSCEQGNYAKALEDITAATISQPARFQKGINEVTFELDRAGKGTLVSLQAFSPGWELNGAPATRFCRAFNTWQGEFEAGKTYTLNYTPVGLRSSYKVALVGILLMLAAVGLSRQTATPVEESLQDG